MDIERLSAIDFEEAMDFVNLVFSQAHRPADFVQMLPKLYKPTNESMRCNLVLRDKGRIRALVGLYPSVWHVGDTTLRLAGIGAVSSHPNDRGKGWMKLLMTRSLEEIKSAGYDLSFLTGLRQRYAYFGYEKAGFMLVSKISSTNLRHFCGDEHAPHLRYEPLQPDDLAYIARAKVLHDRQFIHCERPLDDFHAFLQSMNKRSWVALNDAGQMAGYLVATPEKDSIVEIFAENDDAFAGMIRSWVAQHELPSASVALPYWEMDKARYLGLLCEEAHITSNGNWQIFNWSKVICALLQAKLRWQRLAPGQLTLGISGYGNLCLTVDGDNATCVKTDRLPDLTCDSALATRILLGHLPLAYVAAIPASLEPLTASWFPLPLSWPIPNYV